MSLLVGAILLVGANPAFSQEDKPDWVEANFPGSHWKDEVFSAKPDLFPSINDAKFAGSIEDVDFLEGGDKLLVVYAEKTYWVYPRLILDYHHIVNHQIGTTPVAMTRCTLANTSRIYVRKNGAMVYEFSASNSTPHGTMLMNDQRGRSFWLQMTGQKVLGNHPDLKAKLQVFAPTFTTTWEQFKRKYGEKEGAKVQILLPAESFVSRYTPPSFEREVAEEDARKPWKVEGDDVLDFYRAFQGDFCAECRGGDLEVLSDKQIGMSGTVDPRIKERREPGIGIRIGNETKYYPVAGLKHKEFLNDTVGRTPIILYFDKELGWPRVYLRKRGARNLEFEADLDDDALLIDLETESTWNADGVATKGPQKGAKLTPVPAMSTYWFAWSGYYSDKYETKVGGVEIPIKRPGRVLR